MLTTITKNIITSFVHNNYKELKSKKKEREHIYWQNNKLVSGEELFELVAFGEWVAVSDGGNLAYISPKETKDKTVEEIIEKVNLEVEKTSLVFKSCIKTNKEGLILYKNGELTFEELKEMSFEELEMEYSDLYL